MRLGFAAAAALAMISVNASAAGPEAAQGAHYVSLRTEGANGRRGPGLEHRVDWIYERAGLPLLVLGESGPWRRVRDPDGAEVWMHTRNLDARAMAYVRTAAEMRRNPRPNSGVKAHLSPGVIGALTGCENGWARVAVGGRVGWVEPAALWGADACASD